MALIGALDVERSVMFLILSLIVIVVGLNIVSGLTTMARDRRRDIAMLQVMGATRSDILAVLLMTGAGIGLAGTLVGLALGLPLAWNIAAIKGGLESLSGAAIFPEQAYLFNKLPSRVDYGDVLKISVFVVAASFLAAIPSAWKATRLDPADVMRNG